MITSTGNNRVRSVSALAKKAKIRREQGLFILEGAKMFAELPKDRLKETYVSESFLRQHGEKASELLQGICFEEVSDDVMKYMSDTQTPQGILAVAAQLSHSLNEIVKGDGIKRDSPAHLMILETIQDPGNLGTILRAGEGAGITGVVMNSATADIYNPKVIRSTMGSIYRVPFVYVEDWQQALGRIKAEGIRLYAAHLKGKVSYENEDYRTDTGFLIGNEANGLTEETAAMADCYVRIPMAGQVESLNAAVAASILMFETARQRRN